MDHHVAAPVDVDEFVERYTGVWNEPDPGARRRAIGDLWAEDGVEFTESGEHRGHEALEARITAVHVKSVARGGFVFRAAGDAVGHHDVFRFTTYMVPARGGDVAWTGCVVVHLGEDGLIRQDHQFSDAPSAGVSAGSPPGTRAVVAEFLRRTRYSAPDEVARLYAPEVDWRVDWPVERHPVVPWIRPRSTRTDVADHFATFGRHCSPADGHVSIDDVLVDGADAVLFGTSSQRVPATGRCFAMTFALRLTVKDGLLVRHHMYEDSLAVAQAFAAEEDVER